jgi:glycosyltransferase involved in cell wall biosynthesis
MQHQRIRLAHICEGFEGGVCTYFRTIIPELTKKEFEITLILSLECNEPNSYKVIDGLKKYGVRIKVVPMVNQVNLFQDIRSFFVLLTFLKRERFNIVHTHCSKAGLLGRICAFLVCTKAILHTPHCFAFMRCKSKFRKQLYLLVEQLLGKITTKLIAVSESEAQSAINLDIISPLRCSVVNNALDTMKPLAGSFEKATIKQAYNICKNALVVSTICRLVDYKGINHFLEAVRICPVDNVVFLVVGNGKLKTKIQRFIRSYQLSDKVRLIGHVADIDKIYAISDIVVLCSDAEGQSYSLLEAMRAKCAIVATSVPGNRDLILHGQTGNLTECNPCSIAAAIELLLNNEAERKKYTENAYDYVCKYHNLEKQVIRLKNIYKTCVNIKE